MCTKANSSTVRDYIPTKQGLRQCDSISQKGFFLLSETIFQPNKD